MINKLTLIFASIFLASTCAAGQTIQCPTPKEIKSVAFTTIEKGDHPGVWTLIQKNQYKTPYHWKFSLMLEAKNQSAAIKKSKIALSKLKKIRGPEKVDAVWVCDYKAPSALAAIATQTN